jgi:hypothetical protein
LIDATNPSTVVNISHPTPVAKNVRTGPLAAASIAARSTATGAPEETGLVVTGRGVAAAGESGTATVIAQVSG